MARMDVLLRCACRSPLPGELRRHAARKKGTYEIAQDRRAAVPPSNHRVVRHVAARSSARRSDRAMAARPRARATARRRGERGPGRWARARDRWTNGQWSGGHGGSVQHQRHDEPSARRCCPRASGHTATKLPDGRVLVVGGTTLVTTDDGNGPVSAEAVTSSAEVFDVNAGVWYPAASLSIARSGHTATALLPMGTWW